MIQVRIKTPPKGGNTKQLQQYYFFFFFILDLRPAKPETKGEERGVEILGVVLVEGQLLERAMYSDIVINGDEQKEEWSSSSSSGVQLVNILPGAILAEGTRVCR